MPNILRISRKRLFAIESSFELCLYRFIDTESAACCQASPHIVGCLCVSPVSSALVKSRLTSPHYVSLLTGSCSYYIVVITANFPFGGRLSNAAHVATTA